MRAECLAAVRVERYRQSKKDERGLVVETLAPVLHPSAMQEYFMICFSSHGGKVQATATAQVGLPATAPRTTCKKAHVVLILLVCLHFYFFVFKALLNLLYVAVRNYVNHLDNLLVVDVVGRVMEFVSSSEERRVGKEGVGTCR